MSTYPFPKVDPKLSCAHCGQPIVAVASVFDQGALGVAGLREYEWRHRFTEAAECPPPTVTPTAKPYDAWEATRRIEAVLAARRKAQDAYLDAIETLDWKPDELWLTVTPDVEVRDEAGQGAE